MLTGGPDSYLLLSPLPNMETYKPQYAVSLKFSAMADTVYTYRDNRLISVNILIVYKRQENKTASGNSVVFFFFFLFFFCLEGICRARMGIFVKDRAPLGTPAPPQPTPPRSQSRSWQTWGAFPLTKATFFSLQLDQMLQIYYQMWHG